MKTVLAHPYLNLVMVMDSEEFYKWGGKKKSKLNLKTMNTLIHRPEVNKNFFEKIDDILMYKFSVNGKYALEILKKEYIGYVVELDSTDLVISVNLLGTEIIKGIVHFDVNDEYKGCEIEINEITLDNITPKGSVVRKAYFKEEKEYD